MDAKNYPGWQPGVFCAMLSKLFVQPLAEVVGNYTYYNG